MAVEEERVEVGQQRVADVEGPARGVGHRRPPGRILVRPADRVVVAGERVEGAQLHPALAQRLRGVAEEATDVGADVRYAEQVELHHPCIGFFPFICSFLGVEFIVVYLFG